jgi:hypothetical protein
LKLLWFGAALALVLTGLTVSAQEPAPSTHDADIRELERLETVWNEAHERGDADALEALWADDLEVAVPRMALMTKAGAQLCALRSNEIPPLSELGNSCPGV